MLHDPAQLDLMFQALADPARRSMVERLSRGPASVSQLAEPLAMSLSAVVQHLNLLEASGLVRTQKVGRVRTCQIAPATLRSAERWIAERRGAWERRLDALGEYLAEHPDPAGPAAPAAPGPTHPDQAHPDQAHPDQAHPDQGSIR